MRSRRACRPRATRGASCRRTTMPPRRSSPTTGSTCWSTSRAMRRVTGCTCSRASRRPSRSRGWTISTPRAWMRSTTCSPTRSTHPRVKRGDSRSGSCCSRVVASRTLRSSHRNVRPHRRVANGHVTFGSFNRHAKITDAMLGAWRSILEAHSRCTAATARIGVPRRGDGALAARALVSPRHAGGPHRFPAVRSARGSDARVRRDRHRPRHRALQRRRNDVRCAGVGRAGGDAAGRADDRAPERRAPARSRPPRMDCHRSRPLRSDRASPSRRASDLPATREAMLDEIPRSALCDVPRFTRTLERALRTLATMGPRRATGGAPVEIAS